MTDDESNNTDMNNMIFITQSKNKTFSSNNINKKYLTLSNINTVLRNIHLIKREHFYFLEKVSQKT